MKISHQKTAIQKRKLRVSSKVRGKTERPRLSLFRSNKEIYLQVIDDSQGKTVAYSSTKQLSAKTGTKVERAQAAAKQLAEKLKTAKVKKLVFDRGSYKYHGRVRAVAEVMREQGLEV